MEGNSISPKGDNITGFPHNFLPVDGGGELAAVSKREIGGRNRSESCRQLNFEIGSPILISGWVFRGIGSERKIQIHGSGGEVVVVAFYFAHYDVGAFLIFLGSCCPFQLCKSITCCRSSGEGGALVVQFKILRGGVAIRNNYSGCGGCGITNSKSTCGNVVSSGWNIE